ncbi:MAG: hypothetical protein AAB448_03470 [Patescibacteria group bacterium]|mgnify:CR=1 FL=1
MEKQPGKESTPTCTNAALMLTQVRSLKTTFDSSFREAIASGSVEDVLQAQKDKAELLSAMELLQNHLDSIAYEQTSDTEFLTRMKQKLTEGRLLSRTDLSFLYEVPKPFDGSVEDKQSLREIRATRKSHEDMLMIFKCTENEIAHTVEEINESTKAYVGELEPNIFTRLPEGVEYVYTSFPEGCIPRYSIKIGGKDVDELKELLEAGGHRFDYTKSILEHNDFKRSLYKEDPKDPEKPHYTQWGLKSPEEATLIRLFVNDLGFPSGATTKQIYAKAKALGLELCPPEVGPQFRLQYISRPMYESVYVGMKQIIGSDRNPRVFRVGLVEDLDPDDD